MTRLSRPRAQASTPERPSCIIVEFDPSLLPPKPTPGSCEPCHLRCERKVVFHIPDHVFTIGDLKEELMRKFNIGGRIKLMSHDALLPLDLPISDLLQLSLYINVLPMHHEDLGMQAFVFGRGCNGWQGCKTNDDSEVERSLSSDCGSLSLIQVSQFSKKDVDTDSGLPENEVDASDHKDANGAEDTGENQSLNETSGSLTTEKSHLDESMSPAGPSTGSGLTRENGTEGTRKWPRITKKLSFASNYPGNSPTPPNTPSPMSSTDSPKSGTPSFRVYPKTPLSLKNAPTKRKLPSKDMQPEKKAKQQTEMDDQTNEWKNYSFLLHLNTTPPNTPISSLPPGILIDRTPGALTPFPGARPFSDTRLAATKKWIPVASASAEDIPVGSIISFKYKTNGARREKVLEVLDVLEDTIVGYIGHGLSALQGIFKEIVELEKSAMEDIKIQSDARAAGLDKTV